MPSPSAYACACACAYACTCAYAYAFGFSGRLQASLRLHGKLVAGHRHKRAEITSQGKNNTMTPPYTLTMYALGL